MSGNDHAGISPPLASGLASGGIYASLALALVMIYQATHHVNFAQGELGCSRPTSPALIKAGSLLAGIPDHAGGRIRAGIAIERGSAGLTARRC